ncbi:FMN-binding protein [Leadbettera azotonutricia]|uniref:15 kDa lipoprotein n=1 Tax=Leadbettera azotonutricia (strain ATCC BAA-888 / DSM 13862 / ZAS-9) TaxID=545695 RepID=F5YCI5_LEAAZ|nr:FMN-binding protein [Leadbettera azotonutricia]AEF82318.1 15 kDa lipoprotein [Leadbettera azotonutricia ZAS-9]
MKEIIVVFILTLGLLLLSACGKSAIKDGVYSGRSSPDDTGAYGEVNITVSAGKINTCDFVTWQKDGTIKDEDYGKVNGEISNRAFYDKAQLAVRAMKTYAAQYVAKQNLKSVDTISGATNSYDQFVEAVEEALKK